MARLVTRRRILLLLLGLTIMAGVGTLYLLRDPTPYFLARRSALAAVVQEPVVIEGDYRLQAVRVTGTSGLGVDIMLRRAIEDGDRPLPLVVILGGHHTGRDAVRLLGDSRGTTVAALSYPFTGDPRPDAVTFLRDIPKIRQAFLDTPPAVQLALDHLLQRPEVDTTSVEAVGVSLGAPFMTIAGALDPRITRVWVLHGSGGSFAPLEMAMRRTIGFAPARYVAAAIANVLISGPRLDPEKWASRISPREFVMVNALGDERLPRESIESLFASAREPKEMIWMEGRHIHADTTTVRRLADIVLHRVRR